MKDSVTASGLVVVKNEITSTADPKADAKTGLTVVTGPKEEPKQLLGPDGKPVSSTQ
jgi:hypothetical protein